MAVFSEAFILQCCKFLLFAPINLKRLSRNLSFQNLSYIYVKNRSSMILIIMIINYTHNYYYYNYNNNYYYHYYYYKTFIYISLNLKYFVKNPADYF